MTLDTIYHVGHLAVDREADSENGVLLDKKASRLWSAAKQGEVHLYQRRCFLGFEYHCRAVKEA